MSGETQLWLVRHGTTDANVNGLFLGQTDVPLNEQGHREAQAVATRLADAPIDLVISSDLVRATQTAQAIVDAHSAAPKLEIDPRLREVHLGDFEALCAKQVHAEHPETVERWLTHPETTRMPGENAESLGEVQARAWQLIDDVRADDPNRRIVLVTHTFVILSLCCKALDVPLDRFRKMFLHRASITRIHWGRFGPTLIGFNDTAHIGTE